MSRGGYQLERLRRGLRPYRLHWFPRLRSTNDHAAELRRQGRLYAPAVVLTGKQLAGRGRGSNRWYSSRGDLTVTFVLPFEPHLSALQVPLIAGLAVRNAAAELTGNTAIALKWPNDVMYDDQKLAGLLCERVHNVDLIGIGLNINLDPAEVPPSLRGQVASLMSIGGRTYDLTSVLVIVASHLRGTLGRRHEQPVARYLAEYDRHHMLSGRRVSVVAQPGQKPLSGTCEGIDNIGRLLVRDRWQVHHLFAGHVLVR